MAAVSEEKFVLRDDHYDAVSICESAMKHRHLVLNERRQRHLERESGTSFAAHVAFVSLVEQTGKFKMHVDVT